MNAHKCIALLGLSAIVGTGSVWGQASTALIDQGRALYFGSQTFAAAPQVAGVNLPHNTGACVSCHGALGAGVREGVQVAPDITLGAVQDSTRWLKAAVKGLAMSDRPLNMSMPRYQLTPQEESALAAYAPFLGNAADTVHGVTDSEVTFGVLFSDRPHSLASTQVMAGVALAFKQANLQGGVHGRKLRAIAVRTPEDAKSVFALVGSLHEDEALDRSQAVNRLPNLASLILSREGVKAWGWTVPLLPSLLVQAELVIATLKAKSVELDCTPWVLDTLQITNEQAPALNAMQRFTSAMAASSAARPTRLCLGLIATQASSLKLLEALQRDGQEIPLLVSVAALGTAPSPIKTALHLQVLPAPLAVAAHAENAGQSVWTSLGEAAGRAVVEALARSGRRLQPEIALATMRELSGYAPLEGAPLAWSRTHTHGWLPAVWPMPSGRIGLRQSE
jgi:mono/diheme cytochrome c family protein